MKANVWLAIFALVAVFATFLFGAAGTFRWPGAWAFLAIFLAAVVLMTWRLARNDPALLEERMKPPVREDQPAWDRAIMSACLILFPGWLILMGLDAARFGWSAMPAWLEAVGAGGVAASMWICDRTFRENTFLSPVVKVQAERGHEVVSTGPYAIVRHPMYAAVLLFFPSTALLLGSWSGLAAVPVLASAVLVRTALEDRELRRGLGGYNEYARRVPYRLIPRIW